MGITQTYIVLKPSRHGANTYMPGDMVRGSVVLFIGGSSPCKVSEVTLKVKGRARTHWTTNNGTWTSWYSEKESFLKFVISILRVRKGAPTSLPPGENQLNFSFTLPDGLPHSHEYSCGEVVYKLVARAVNSQHLSWNGSTKMHFTVLQRRDLRTIPQLARRLVVERKRKNCNRRDDPGEFTIILGRQGFVPGDVIDVYIQGTDEVLSALAQDEGIVKLKRFEEFRAGAGRQQHKPVLVKKRLGMDPAEWRHFQLTMPKDDIGIDPDVCHIIAVSHYIKIWDVHLPVTLGTIPLGKRSSSGTPSRTASGASLAQSSQTPSKAPSGTASGTALAPLSQALSKILSRATSGAPLGSSSQTPSRAPSRTPSGTPLAPSSQTPSKAPSRAASGASLIQSSQTPSKAPSRTTSGAPLAPSSQTPCKTPSRTSGTPLAPSSRTPSKTPSRSPSGAALTDTHSQTPSRTPSRSPSGALLTDAVSPQAPSRPSSSHILSSQTPSRTPSETSTLTSRPSQTSPTLAPVSQLTPSPGAAQTPLSQQPGASEISRPGCKTTDV